ncbi:hypothetical protein GQE99_10170 [Maritimibacter sp. DP07]|uniref:Uncharacterized protein n=1 Tax=Maritimibacter harenae TaxID=2606218 RepID=A0A845M2E1_9RHOB|nr:hypothetical protein [Maritimibacter harenae]MZR13382.1 hypothetical protein [Maritimibacter harenae]
MTRYYRIIVDDASARPDPMAHSEWARAALALAEAEARLAQCTTVEHITILQFTEGSDNGVEVGSPEVAMKMDPAHEHMAALVELLSESEDPVMGRMLKSCKRRTRMARRGCIVA